MVQAGEAEAQDGRDWGRYIAGVDSRYSREGKGRINRVADLQQSHVPHRLSHQEPRESWPMWQAGFCSIDIKILSNLYTYTITCIIYILQPYHVFHIYIYCLTVLAVCSRCPSDRSIPIATTMMNPFEHYS